MTIDAKDLERHLNWIEGELEENPSYDMEGYKFKDVALLAKAARAHLEALKQVPKQVSPIAAAAKILLDCNGCDLIKLAGGIIPLEFNEVLLKLARGAA